MEAIMNLWEEEVDQPLPESEYASKAKEFVQECRSMLAFISDGYCRCDWMGKEEWSLRGCVLQYLGYRLWHLLVGARELFDLRQRLLCDEHCADFQALVELVDNRCLVLISRLIWDAEEVWKAAGGQCLAMDGAKAELIRVLQEMKPWMNAVLRNGEVQKLLSEKCMEWRLHYNVLVPDDRVTPVGGYFRSVFKCLMLLAIPSSRVVPKDMGALFRNGFNTFRQSSYGVAFQEAYALRVKKALEHRDVPARLQWLEEKKIELQERIATFLCGFRISYRELDEKEMAHFCRKLYARLNPTVRTFAAESAALPRMTDKDLFRYFLGEMQLRVLQEEVGRQRSQSHRVEAETGRPADDTVIFHPLVDERRLAESFRSVYTHCRESEEDVLQGKWSDMDFAAYLFVLVEKERLGREGFGDNSKAPFYRFVQERVIVGLRMDQRTFYNRLEKKLKRYRDYFLDKAGRQEENAALEANVHVRNFHTMQNLFHGTDYGEVLREAFKSYKTN